MRHCKGPHSLIRLNMRIGTDRLMDVGGEGDGDGVGVGVAACLDSLDG